MDKYRKIKAKTLGDAVTKYKVIERGTKPVTVRAEQVNNNPDVWKFQALKAQSEAIGLRAVVDGLTKEIASLKAHHAKEMADFKEHHKKLMKMFNNALKKEK